MANTIINKPFLIKFLLIVSALGFLIFVVLSFSGQSPNRDQLKTSIVKPKPTASITQEPTLDHPFDYFVKAGQSIYDIAKELDIPVHSLLLYNTLDGYYPLKTGQKLSIPKQLIEKTPQEFDTTKAEGLPEHLTITASKMWGEAPLKVQFRCINAELDDYFYIWDMGCNRFSFSKTPDFLYTRAGRYPARLIIYDRYFNQLSSNTIFINVPPIMTDNSGPAFLTLDRLGDLLNLKGRMLDSRGFPVIINPGADIIQNPALIRQIGPDSFVATNTGYSSITIRQNENSYHFYLFVSPFPSKHSVEPEFDWYFTQYDTGMYGNCGPASNSIAVKWATGKSYSVETIREEIGMPYENGGVDYNNLRSNMRHHGVHSSIKKIDSAQDIFDIIDQGKIIISVFHCGLITPTEGDETKVFTGRYYPDSTGHYIVIKGYSLDKKYAIVYDAIPGDWLNNSLRYDDGVSMIGRNRYFLMDDLMPSLRLPDVIVIDRKARSN
ncbi:MAG: C39 family peptidase [Spirochaetales bacterium]|nr:C39 family peptidase [Spirochaetales bacterium]